MIFDKFEEECGVAGVYGDSEAANLVYLCLYALQHRGQEGAGIAALDSRNHIHCEKGLGLVNDIFSETRLSKLNGEMAIGHNRYSTSGANLLKNTQPIVAEINKGQVALAHNGNIVNAYAIRDRLVKKGAIFTSTSDSEIIIHLIAKSERETLEDALIDSLKELKGAYSIIFMTEKHMIGIRDPLGVRPLILGKKRTGYVLVSESCALDLIEAEFIREIEPGEMIIIGEDGIKSLKPFENVIPKPCIFEYIYFARPDSVIFNHSVYDVRKKMGAKLAEENPVDADIVIPVPDSGIVATLGYAERSGIPFELGLIRNHYVGRTFIEPAQSIRHFGVKIKLNAVKSVIQNKRVIVVDDSIVRGTTSRKIVKMLREAGAKEVHFRVSSPPTRFPCFYGIDTPTRKELIASTHDIDEIKKYITADSVGYLSLQGLCQCVEGMTYCDACFSGDYPTMHLETDEYNPKEK